MATNSYETVGGFKGWIILSDPIDDDTIDRALEAASRGIDNYCNTHFWQTAAATARFFDSCESWRVRIGDAVAVTEVATDTDHNGVFDTVWTASDFQVLPLNRTAPEPMPITELNAVGTLRFPAPATRVGLIRVTGTWGWPAVPEAVVQACRLTTNRLLKRKNSPEGVAGFDEFGIVRISTRDDPDAVRYLTPYRTVRRAGGWAFA